MVNSSSLCCNMIDFAGRVHAAVISGSNDANGTITVEWFENEETKGKEIDLSIIAELNGLKKTDPAQPRPVSANAPPSRRSPKQQRKPSTGSTPAVAQAPRSQSNVSNSSQAPPRNNVAASAPSEAAAPFQSKQQIQQQSM